MKTHCRCRKCRRRKVLRMPPSWYKNKRKCSYCSGELVPDRWMNRRVVKPCYCIGYSFQHQYGSRYCFNRKDGTRRPVEALNDPFKDREAEYDQGEEDWQPSFDCTTEAEC